MVDFGGTLQWLEPAFGTTQAYRIVDALLASDIAFSYAWRDVDGIPRRVFPPGALILAITPLLDERSIGLVTDLRRRGCDLTVIEVSPLDHVSPGSSAAGRRGLPTLAAAARGGARAPAGARHWCGGLGP